MATLLRLGCAAVAFLTLGPAWAGLSPREAVVTLRTPDGGRLPRAVVDADETLHLVYVRGEANGANLFHVTREPGSPAWYEPRRVNSRELSVSGVGPIDGGQLALGPDNRLHVVWLQRDPAGFFYTRSRADGSGFEPQRDLSAGEADGAEAGPAVAVDGGGNVFVFWHAGAVEDARRGVYLTVSRDGGTTFERFVEHESASPWIALGIPAGYTVDDRWWMFATAGQVFKPAERFSDIWSGTYPASRRSAVLAVVPAPVPGDERVFAATSAGVYRSATSGASWAAINSGLSNLAVLTVVASPDFATDHTVYAMALGGEIWRWIDPPAEAETETEAASGEE